LKILIDQNVSARLAGLLTGHNATHASSLGWAVLTNGDLLTAAEAADFEIFVTADKNIRYQQNLAGRRIALVVLGTNQLDILFANVDQIRQAVDAVPAGGYVTVEFDRPPLRRRTYPPEPER
jgi:predicted nuclease of predicted toxin-antitoxin system